MSRTHTGELLEAALRRAHGLRAAAVTRLPATYRGIPTGDHVLGNVPHEATDATLGWVRELAFLRYAGRRRAVKVRFVDGTE